MPDVSAFENHLMVSGRKKAPRQVSVSFLKNTPLADHIHHFADDIECGGSKLDIAVNLNMVNAADVKVEGQ